MHVWVLQNGEPLPGPGVRKMRTGMLVDALVARGHSVTWWTTTFDHFSRTFVFPDERPVCMGPGVTVQPLRSLPYRRTFSFTRWLGYRLAAARFRVLARRMPRPDVIVASLPDHFTAYEAVRFARAERIPVVVDVRDEWPELFVDMVPAVCRPVTRALLCDDFSRFRYAVRHADAVTSMLSQLLKWAQAGSGRGPRPQDRVFYIGSQRLPVDRNGEESPKIRDLLRACQGKFVVAFVGTFGKHYNPAVIVRAATRLEALPNVLFVIAGHGDLFSRVAELAMGTRNVLLPGWLHEREIGTLLGFAQIGVVPAHYVINAMPNKVFVYLSAGLAIAASVQGELRSLIDQYGIGVYFPPGDDQVLAERIAELAGNPDRLAEMRRRSRELFETRFEAGRIYREFATHIESLKSDRPAV